MANNLLLSVILGIVLVGTLYPLGVEAVSGEKLSVGPPYFNAAAGPLALIMIAIMAAGPLIRWRRDKGKDVLRRIAVPLLLALAVAAAVLLLVPGMRVLPLLGFVVAAGAGVAIQPLSQALQEYPEMAGPYRDIHARLAPEGGTVQMFARAGYGPQVGPSPRWPLEAKVVDA